MRACVLIILTTQASRAGDFEIERPARFSSPAKLSSRLVLSSESVRVTRDTDSVRPRRLMFQLPSWSGISKLGSLLRVRLTSKGASKATEMIDGCFQIDVEVLRRKRWRKSGNDEDTRLLGVERK